MNSNNAYPPGWYPDNAGVTRYWDGNKFLDIVAPGSGQPQKSIAIGLAVGGGALVIGLVGLVLAFTSASLLTGTGTQWTGFALTALAAVGSAIATVLLWKRIHLGIAIPNLVIPSLIVLLALANVIYLEVQLEEKREDFRSSFTD